MMSRMEVSRPPGVLMVMRIRLACSLLACSISRTRYSERIGSISPSMWSSTTVEFIGDAGGAVCAGSGAEAMSESAASAEESSNERRTALGNISQVIIAAVAAGAVMFRWDLGKKGGPETRPYSASPDWHRGKLQRDSQAASLTLLR